MRNLTRSQFLQLSAALAGAAGLSKLPFGKANGQPNAQVLLQATYHHLRRSRFHRPLVSSNDTLGGWCSECHEVRTVRSHEVNLSAGPNAGDNQMVPVYAEHDQIESVVPRAKLADRTAWKFVDGDGLR